MKTVLVPALALVLASLAPAAVAQPPTASSATAPPQNPQATADAVNKVQAFYDKTTSFTSDFQQKFTVKAYNQEKTSAGSVTFAKPGKMSWTYTNPTGNRVVSDGATVRVYEAANKQMYEQPVDRATSQHAAALSFLTGQGKLSDSFNFELWPGEKLAFPGGFVLVGNPKVPTPSYTKVLFYVDTATSQVRRVMIIDGQGNRNRFDFTNPRVNDEVTPATFVFTPPAGTQIVRP